LVSAVASLWLLFRGRASEPGSTIKTSLTSPIEADFAATLGLQQPASEQPAAHC